MVAKRWEPVADVGPNYFSATLVLSESVKHVTAQHKFQPCIIIIHNIGNYYHRPPQHSSGQTSTTASRIPWQTLLTFRLGPLETLGNLDGAVFHPCLCSAPVDAFVHGVRIGNWIGMIQHPIKGEQAHVKIAHDSLSDEVDAVFEVPFVHLRDSFLVLLHFGEI